MHRLSPSLVIAAIAAAAPVAVMAQTHPRTQIEIELRPEVVATQRQVMLGDVAFLRTTDLAAIQRLVALPLGPAPRPGNEAVMDRATLARWIRSQLGIASEQLSWNGAERSHIKGSLQLLPAQRIEQAARAALEQWLSSRASRFDIESTGLRDDLNLPAGRVELRARSLPTGSNPSARMVVWVDVAVEGAFARTVPVTFLVEAYREAWVAKSGVAPGATLAPTMIERREVEVSSQRAAVFAAGDAAEAPPSVGLRSRRSLKAGEPLNAQNAERISAVGRGEWVTLLLKTGGTQLEGRAEALQEGDLGQVVKVRMAGASSSVEALVVDRGRVEAMP